MTGEFIVAVNGREYTMFLGMTALSRMQIKHGNDVFSKLEKPDDAGDTWLPPLQIMVDLIKESLVRHHKNDVSDEIVDDILRSHPDAFERLLAATFPPAPTGEKSGNGRGPAAE